MHLNLDAKKKKCKNRIYSLFLVKFLDFIAWNETHVELHMSLVYMSILVYFTKNRTNWPTSFLKMTIGIRSKNHSFPNLTWSYAIIICMSRWKHFISDRKNKDIFRVFRDPKLTEKHGLSFTRNYCNVVQYVCRSRNKNPFEKTRNPDSWTRTLRTSCVF